MQPTPGLSIPWQQEPTGKVPWGRASGGLATTVCVPGLRALAPPNCWAGGTCVQAGRRGGESRKHWAARSLCTGGRRADGGRGRGQDSQGASPAPRGARDGLLNSTILPTPRLGNLGTPPSSLHRTAHACVGGHVPRPSCPIRGRRGFSPSRTERRLTETGGSSKVASAASRALGHGHVSARRPTLPCRTEAPGLHGPPVPSPAFALLTSGGGRLPI